MLCCSNEDPHKRYEQWRPAAVGREEEQECEWATSKGKQRGEYLCGQVLELLVQFVELRFDLCAK